MNTFNAEVVICGAGIAGVAVAYTLARRGVRQVVLVDPRPPLSLTSDKSTECYRDFWPGPGDAMVGLIGRSIDLLEGLAHESDNRFRMNRRGYLYVTRTASGAANLLRAAEEAAQLGAGPLRIHGPHAPATQPYQRSPLHGIVGAPRGADYISDPALIQAEFPYLAADVTAVLHARRCGWLSAQQLGMYLLEQARAAGVQVVMAQLVGVDCEAGQVTGVRLAGAEAPAYITTPCLINCAGPLLGEVGRLLGLELPVVSERHTKLAFEDRLGAIPREAPMVIAADPIWLDWSAEERELLADDPVAAGLLGELAAGAHLRPEGEGTSPWVLALWGYDAASVPVVFPAQFDQTFADVVLRGLSTIVPNLHPYVERPPRPTLDGGYYTKTPENRPLIGPLPIAGAYVLGALSGYGIMAALGAAELLAAHVLGEELPAYAVAFLPQRYADPAYQALLAAWGDTGQL
jgi:glycine/D-amino acid oxidase-like deaminating enzyme